MRSVLSRGGGGGGGFLAEGALGFLLHGAELLPRGEEGARLLGDHSTPGRNVIPLTA